MDDGGSPAAGALQAMLDAWRARGADQADPIRAAFIEALARRAQAYDGEARRLLDARLDSLAQTDGQPAGQTRQSGQTGQTGRAAEASPAASPYAAATGSALPGADQDTPCAVPPEAPALAALARSLDDRRPDTYPELAALDYFRTTWTRLNTDRQVRQSLEQVPENAGPINSSHLVHRSLSLMRERSPGYLHQFLSYLDALAWMERLGDSATPRTGAAAARKNPRGKPR